MSRRILITGSRSWPPERLAELVLALREHGSLGDTLVHGAADGIDSWAAELWKRASFGPIESYRAEDFPDPKARNLHMISLGADVCLAFAMSWASGTGHCARHARKAGIETVDFGVDTRIEARSFFRG